MSGFANVKAVYTVKILKKNAGNSVQTFLCRYAKLHSEGLTFHYNPPVKNK